MAGNKLENKDKKTPTKERVKNTEGELKTFFDHTFLPGVGILAGLAGMFTFSAGCLMISLLDKGNFDPHILGGFFQNTFNF